jgi:Icc-related predicted phosphoesterase
MKIVCISDTHNKHEELDMSSLGDDTDILIHAGDFTNFGKRYEIKKFVEWFEKQRARYRVLVAGNHELSLDDDYIKAHQPSALNLLKQQVQSLVKQNENIIYLENSGAEIDGLYVYGSPCSLKGSTTWGFQVEEKDGSAEEIWASIPTDTDLLITHSPPLGILDEYNNTLYGCPTLFKHVFNRIKPRVHVFGHIHDQHGIQMKSTDTGSPITFINATSVNGKHEVTGVPIIQTIYVKL